MISLAPCEDKTLDSYEFSKACKILENEGADVVGLNCYRGPETKLPILENIIDKLDCSVASNPVPYRTTHDKPTFKDLCTNEHQAFPLELEPHQLTRYEMADFARQAERLGVDIIGGCCGFQSYQLRAMALELRKKLKAEKYAPDMSLHPRHGDESNLNE
jgi:betaine-homocysteine S-methyltransferase